MSGFINWLDGLPTIVLFLSLTVAGLVGAAALSWLSARAIEDDVRTRTSASVIAVVGVVAGIYAVLVGFVIVNEWQTFNDAQAQLSSESAALTTAYVDAGTFPEPNGFQIRRALIVYDRSVICVELPNLSADRGPALPTRRALEDIFKVTANASAETQSSAFYSNAVGEISQIATARRARINAASSALPNLLLIVILVTSVALVAVASVLDTQHRRWHLILTTALTVLVALNIALVITLDRPYAGAASVSDAPLREGIPSALLRCRA